MHKHMERWNRRYAAAEMVWSAEPNATVAQELDTVAPGRALDLGCGEGRNAIWLAGRGWDVTAVDFSSVAIDKARRLAERMGVKVDWRQADVVDFAPAEAYFDLVLCTFLHTSPQERDRWLHHAASAVAPGGLFIYLGHDPSNVERGHGGPRDPAVLPSAADVADRLDGFEIETARVVRRGGGHETGHGDTAAREPTVALDTLVRAIKRCAA